VFVFPSKYAVLDVNLGNLMCNLSKMLIFDQNRRFFLKIVDSWSEWMGFSKICHFRSKWMVFSKIVVFFL